MENTAQQEDLLEKCLNRGDKGTSIKLLLELSMIRAKEKNFEAAEALRDRIFEIDPMALSEIIRSKEIIEEEKSKAIDRTHREVWAKLYDELSVEEANALYFSLKTTTYGPGEMVFNQGKHKPGLYFINSGRPKIVCSQNNTEVLVKFLNPGQLAGEETFLFDTVHTTSMIAISRVEVSFLDIHILKKLKPDFPVLESKLREFAVLSDKAIDLLKSKSFDRRAHRRIKVTGNGMVQLISSNGANITKPFKVDMCDISQGGLCCFINLVKRETASLLLGKRLNIIYSDPPLKSGENRARSGSIVAVRYYELGDSTIHVKFDDFIGNKLINELFS